MLELERLGFWRTSVTFVSSSPLHSRTPLFDVDLCGIQDEIAYYGWRADVRRACYRARWIKWRNRLIPLVNLFASDAMRRDTRRTEDFMIWLGFPHPATKRQRSKAS